MNEIMRRETREAITAGECALGSLYAAREKLGSARNWGIFDMVGGGFFSTMIKRSKMSDAAGLMEQARRDLQIFSRELQDIQGPLDLNIELGGFLSFADYFFDGLVADFLVQSRIIEAQKQVDDAIAYVEPILNQLKQQVNER